MSAITINVCILCLSPFEPYQKLFMSDSTFLTYCFWRRVVDIWQNDKDCWSCLHKANLPSRGNILDFQPVSLFVVLETISLLIWFLSLWPFTYIPRYFAIFLLIGNQNGPLGKCLICLGEFELKIMTTNLLWFIPKPDSPIKLDRMWFTIWQLFGSSLKSKSKSSGQGRWLIVRACLEILILWI